MPNRLENISLDDSVLVGRCQQGDSNAQEMLIVKYQDRVFNVILKICGNYDDAAELTQETFVKFIEKIGTFKGKSAFYTWLFRIAVNLTINYCKRRVKLGMVSLDAVRNPEFDQARYQLKAFLTDEGADDPALAAQNKEVAEIIARSLEKLDEHQRTVIILRDMEGMSYIEIAEALEIELGTVKSRLYRARMSLKEILETVLK